MQLKIHNQNYSAERIDRNNRCLSVFHYQKSRLKYSRGTSWPLKFVVINQKIKNPCLWFQFHIYQDLSVAAIICKCEMSEWSRKECFFKSALEKSPCKNSWSSLFWLWKTAPILYRDQLSLLKPDVRTAPDWHIEFWGVGMTVLRCFRFLFQISTNVNFLWTKKIGCL